MQKFPEVEGRPGGVARAEHPTWPDQLALSVLRWAFAIWKLMRKVSFDLLRLGSICQLLTNAFCAPPSYVTFLGCSAKMGEKMYSLEYIYQGLDD